MANKGGQYVIVDGKKIPRDTHQGQNKPHKTQPEKATTRPEKHTQHEDSVDDTAATV